MLTQRVNLVDLLAHISGEKPITLEGYRISSIEFVIGHKSDGYNDRDSRSGGVPFVDGAAFTWAKK